MKLSKSKLSLAKVINENGGWIDDSANWAVQPKHEDGDIWFSNSDNKPYRNEGLDGFTFDGRGLWLDDVIKHNKLHQNWHQCVLSREEYYQAYPVSDADGWIEWGGGECPVQLGTLVDVKYANGITNIGVSALTDKTHADHTFGTAGSLLATNWSSGLPMSGIIAYRLHKPERENPESCEPVMSALIGVDMASGSDSTALFTVNAKPTIEQLAADYRNKLDYATLKRQEADEAKAAADAALGELERAGEALGLLIVIAKPDREPELVITDWRDLQVNDVIFVGEYDEHESG